MLGNQLRSYITELYGYSPESLNFSLPPKKELGDQAFGCFVLSKELKKSPQVIAGELQEFISQKSDSASMIDKVVADGPYLNIFLSSGSIEADLKSFFAQENILPQVSQKTVCIDYIGANVGKPLHIGHMCTPNQGQVFVNLFRKLGYTVIADSHLGDWGIIFGKLIVAYKRFGDAHELETRAVDHLFDLYVKISSLAEEEESLEQEFRDAFKLLSSGDSESVALWKSFTLHSIQGMGMQLKRLNINADYNIGESFYEGLGLPKLEDYPDLTYSMHEIVEELIEKGIATKNDDNSVGVVFPDDSKIPSCILQKRDGTHGYLASDLAAVKYRVGNWGPERIIYFVDVRQQLHLRQVFEIAKMAGWVKEHDTELFHAYNGFISLKDGAMSTRKGKIIKLDVLLDEGIEKAKAIILEKRDDISGEKLDELSRIIGIGAIKYGYLKKSRGTDVVFDWDEFMSFEGNSGPYIQYAYVRAKKVIEKSTLIPDLQSFDLEHESQKLLAQKIMLYPEIIESMQKGYYPHVLCNYIYELTKDFSTFYNSVSVLQAENSDIILARVNLVTGFMKIIEESFEILGIELPDEM